MKKPIRKLVLRSETIRALRALDHSDLTRAAGGLFDSADACTDRAVVESGRINCPAPAVVATAVCG